MKEHNNDHNSSFLGSFMLVIIPTMMALFIFGIAFTLPWDSAPAPKSASQSTASATASARASTPATTEEAIPTIPSSSDDSVNPLSYAEFMSKMEDEIMAETQASLESVFVRYPDFLVQERTLVLGQGGTEDDNRDTAVIVSELHKAYQDSKMRVVVEHKDSMNDEQSAMLLDGNVALSIDYGNFSVEKDWVKD